jgi:hypothetical protein
MANIKISELTAATTINPTDVLPLVQTEGSTMFTRKGTVSPLLPGLAKTTDLSLVATSGSYADLTDKPTIPVLPSLATVATSGSYNDLTDKPTITGGSTPVSYNDLTDKPTIPVLPTLATVATSGSYNDLSDKPTIPVLPTLATVATTGSYNDLTDKPVAPVAPTPETITASANLTAAHDKNTLLVDSTDPVVITVQTDAVGTYPVGARTEYFVLGSGSVSVVGDAGVTVNTSTTFVAPGQYDRRVLIKVGTDTWIHA